MGDAPPLSALSIGDNKVLKAKVIEIGDWNMDADNSVTVLLGLSDTLEYRKIRSMNVIIRDDNNTFYRDLSHLTAFNDGTPDGGYISSIQTTNVVLVRILNGIFDGVLYDSTSYNRGWVTIWYES
jgi:hypothetical protein